MMEGREEKTGKKNSHAGIGAGLDVMEGRPEEER